MTDFTRAARPRRPGCSAAAWSTPTTSSSPPRDNLVNPEPPTFAPRTFGAKGQVYDGWETRRRRDARATTGPIVRLGAPGVVRGVVVDTAFFTGNYPPHASVEGCGVDGLSRRRRTGRRRLVPAGAAVAAARATPATSSGRPTARRFTHVRLQHLPRRRRRPAARARRRRCPTRRLLPGGRRPRRARARRAGRRLQQHVLRLADNLIAARPGPHHGRGLGDRPPPRRRQRLGAGPARRARHDPRSPSSTPATSRATRPAAAPLRGIDAVGRRPDDGLVRAAAAHPAAARHPAPLPRSTHAPTPPTSGWTSTPTAAWPGCACRVGSHRTSSAGCGGGGRSRCRRPTHASSRHRHPGAVEPGRSEPDGHPPSGRRDGAGRTGRQPGLGRELRAERASVPRGRRAHLPGPGGAVGLIPWFRTVNFLSCLRTGPAVASRLPRRM